jgi:hypothetical protein
VGLWAALIWLLAGCQWVIQPPAAQTAQAGAPVVLAPGQTAHLADAGLTLHFESVRSDDRCPKQVACEWEGEARLALTAQAGDGPARPFELSTYAYSGQDTWLYTGYVIRLVEVAPYPETPEQPIAADAYRATLQVEPLADGPISATFNLPFQLPLGRAADVAEGALTVTWTHLLDDSRCPTQVSCVWDGEARLALTVQPAGAAAQEVEITTNSGAGPDTVEVGGYVVRLWEVTPYPDQPDPPIRPEEYSARLSVMQR